MSGIAYLFVIGLSLVLILINVFNKKLIPEKGQGIVLAILFFVLIFESIGEYTAEKGINNTLLYNICWVYLESLLLIMYFYQLEYSKTYKKKILIISAVLLGWGIVNSIFFQAISSVFQFYSFLPNGIFIVALSIRLLSNMLNLRIFKEWNLISIPHFWISTGVLFFYTEALFVFGMYQFYPQFVIDNVSVIFGFNRMMAAMMYFVFGISFLLSSMIKKNYNEGNSMAML
jgi:hypothetical protein